MQVHSHNRGLQIPLNSNIEDMRDVSTSVFLQVKYLPLLIVFILLSALFVCFSLFFFESRIESNVPSISELATSTPNKDVFSIFQTIFSIFLTVLFILYISAADAWNAMSSLSVNVCRIVGYICPFFLIVLSCCSIEDNYYVHIVSLISASFSFCLFFAITLIQMRKNLLKHILLLRTIFLFFIFAAFVVILVFACLNRAASSLFAIAEYVFLLFTAAFILSFSKDLSLIRLQVVTLDYKTN